MKNTSFSLCVFALSASLLGTSVLTGCADETESIVAGIRSDNPAVREDKVVIARRFQDPAVIEALIESLEDESDEVRKRAVFSLAELDAQEAAPALVTLLQTETNAEVKKAAIDAVGRLKNAAAVPALLGLIQEMTPDSVPLNAIWALGNIGERSALPTLVKLRENATNPYVVFNANMALRKLR